MIFLIEQEYKIESNESNMDNIKYKLTINIEYVNKIYSKKDELIGIINSLVCTIFYLFIYLLLYI